MTTPPTEPEFVPVLVAEEMCKGTISRDAEGYIVRSADGVTFCLMGHLNRTFIVSHWLANRDLWHVAHDALKHAAGIPLTARISMYNDNHSLAQNAKVWNEAMAAIGYTEHSDREDA